MLYIFILNRKKKPKKPVFKTTVWEHIFQIFWVREARSHFSRLEGRHLVVYMYFPDKVIIMTEVKECRFRVVFLYVRDTLEKMSISLSWFLAASHHKHVNIFLILLPYDKELKCKNFWNTGLALRWLTEMFNNQ